MIQTYILEIDAIKAILENFYMERFINPEEEHAINKRNKEQVEELIIRIKQDHHLHAEAQQQLVKEALKLLSENTGCAEDEAIAETILDNLFYRLKIISRDDIDDYYRNTAAGRWH